MGNRPQRIGMLGFSAGGHLTAWAATHFDERAYSPIDETDKVSCRPDFAVLIYPGGMDRKDDAASPIAPCRPQQLRPCSWLRRRRPGELQEQRGDVPGLEKRQGSGRAAHLLVRRSRLRPASQRPPLLHLARPLRGVAAQPADPQFRVLQVSSRGFEH